MSITTQELHWAAGFLEGEGSFAGATGYARCVTACQVQKEPLVRLHRMFGGRMYLEKKRSKRWHNVWRWALGSSEGIGLMMTLYPLMSPRRKGQIKAVLRRWKESLGQGGYLAAKTHCPQGHPYSLSNTYVRPGAKGRSRACRRCLKAHAKSYKRSYRKAA